MPRAIKFRREQRLFDEFTRLIPRVDADVDALLAGRQWQRVFGVQPSKPITYFKVKGQVT